MVNIFLYILAGLYFLANIATVIGVFLEAGPDADEELIKVMFINPIKYGITVGHIIRIFLLLPAFIVTWLLVGSFPFILNTIDRLLSIRLTKGTDVK